MNKKIVNKLAQTKERFDDVNDFKKKKVKKILVSMMKFFKSMANYI